MAFVDTSRLVLPGFRDDVVGRRDEELGFFDRRTGLAGLRRGAEEADLLAEIGMSR